MVRNTILLTGATGLLGRATVQELLQRTDARIVALARDPRSLSVSSRLTLVRGDITESGLGLDPDVYAQLRREVHTVVHMAANTSFSQNLNDARWVNVVGTRRLLELAQEAKARFVFMSTAFVAGRRTGLIMENTRDPQAGFLNAYEQSKHEAEELVRERAADWLVLRPSTVISDDTTGTVTQINAVHRGLQVYYRGLAAMMPGSEDTLVDMVPADYVARAAAALALRRDVSGRTLHLCAGRNALPLGELLDSAYALWGRSPAWRRRGVDRPVLTGLSTYRLFEQSIDQTGDARLQRIMRSLSHFIPQLGYPKVFDTSGAEALLGERSPAVRQFWPQMLEHLLRVHWRGGELDPMPLEQVA